MSTPFQPDPKWMPRLAKIVSKVGEFYNRYEIQGLENIPASGGALLVLYHGLVPLDFWYLGLTIYMKTGRQPCALADRWMFKMPGLNWLTRAVGGVPGERAIAVELLKAGVLVGVSPGGVREAISGGENDYRLNWGQRKGFAEIAIEAGVPIIPGFTQNVEGLYRAPFAGSKFFQDLYEKTRLPLVPIVGLGPLPFPVKLTSWLGEPLRPGAGESAEDLVQRTRLAIEALIAKHQR